MAGGSTTYVRRGSVFLTYRAHSDLRGPSLSDSRAHYVRIGPIFLTAILTAKGPSLSEWRAHYVGRGPVFSCIGPIITAKGPSLSDWRAH